MIHTLWHLAIWDEGYLRINVDYNACLPRSKLRQNAKLIALNAVVENRLTNFTKKDRREKIVEGCFHKITDKYILIFIYWFYIISIYFWVRPPASCWIRIWVRTKLRLRLGFGVTRLKLVKEWEHCKKNIVKILKNTGTHSGNNIES